MLKSPFILISAIICTYNRAHYLAKAIQSLVDQSLGSTKYEIIVVDNNSTDKTQTVVAKDFADIPNLHYVFEPKLGLSQARNTGLAQAKGQYVAYLDDDAIAAPDWLEATLRCFETATFPIGCVGGKIDPIWEAPCPDWLPRHYFASLTILDWGTVPILIDSKKYVAGANMAFPADLLRELGGFNTELGRKGKKLLSSEEVWLQETIRRKGYVVYYDPAIVVQHHVPAARLVPDWFFQRVYWQGFSRAFLDFAQDPDHAQKRLGLVATYIKRLLSNPKDYLYFWLPINHPHRFHRRCVKHRDIGYLWGIITLSGRVPQMPDPVASVQPVASSQ